jgi:rfaE bifunctional protein kinase chain/domain
MVADVYISGTPTRVSREAPVLIIRHENEWVVPGSAANAAANLMDLGATVYPIGVIGNDAEGKMLSNYFKERGADTAGLVTARSLRTTTKMRILAGDVHTSKQQVVRVDRESAGLSPSIDRRVLKAVEEIAPNADAFLVSDYGYGILTAKILDRLESFKAGGKFVLGDSRYALEAFDGLTIVTPNEDEISSLAEEDLSDDADLFSTGEDIRAAMRWDALLVTRGNKGMTLFEAGESPRSIPIAGSSDIVDVSGAGDTVAAAVLLALIAGGSFMDAARLANYAASVVVMKRGTATASAKELRAAVRAGEGTDA